MDQATSSCDTTWGRNGPPETWGPNTLLSKAEFCQWAGVTERTLGQWITDGTAPKRLLFGRHVRIKFSDALEWAETRYVS